MSINEEWFSVLLESVIVFAFSKGFSQISLGINSANTKAIDKAFSLTFHIKMTGVAMVNNAYPSSIQATNFVIEDWR